MRGSRKGGAILTGRGRKLPFPVKYYYVRKALLENPDKIGQKKVHWA